MSATARREWASSLSWLLLLFALWLAAEELIPVLTMLRNHAGELRQVETWNEFVLSTRGGFAALRELLFTLVGALLGTYVIWQLFVPHIEMFPLLQLQRMPKEDRVHTIADAMHAAELRRDASTLLVLLAAFAITIVAYRLVGDREVGYAAVGVGTAYVLILLRQQCVAFRGRRGYFANNEHEIRRLLRFIVSNVSFSDTKDDFGNPRPLLRVPVATAEGDDPAQARQWTS